MATDRHNAHMKIDKAIWDRAHVAAALDGKSMTQFVEEALVTLIDIKHDQKENDR